MKRRTNYRCELCRRERPLTFHHLIPRTLHSNKWFKKRFQREDLRMGVHLCADCHSAVHRFLRAKELGRTYNTREKLLAQPEVAKFVSWIAKRDIGRVCTRRSSRRR